jgi:hypothetical protein
MTNPTLNQALKMLNDYCVIPVCKEIYADILHLLPFLEN